MMMSDVYARISKDQSLIVTGSAAWLSDTTSVVLGIPRIVPYPCYAVRG